MLQVFQRGDVRPRKPVGAVELIGQGADGRPEFAQRDAAKDFGCPVIEKDSDSDLAHRPVAAKRRVFFSCRLASSSCQSSAGKRSRADFWTAARRADGTGNGGRRGGLLLGKVAGVFGFAMIGVRLGWPYRDRHDAGDGRKLPTRRKFHVQTSKWFSSLATQKIPLLERPARYSHGGRHVVALASNVREMFDR